MYKSQITDVLSGHVPWLNYFILFSTIASSSYQRHYHSCVEPLNSSSIIILSHWEIITFFKGVLGGFLYFLMQLVALYFDEVVR